MSLDFDSLMMMCLVSLYEFIFFWNLLHLVNVQMNVFRQIWEVFGYFFFKYFFASFYCFSFYKIFSMHMLVCLMMSCRPFSLLCLRLDNINWPVFKFSDYFSCQFKSALEPFQGILYFSYCTSQFQNFCLLLFIICSSVLTVSVQ